MLLGISTVVLRLKYVLKELGTSVKNITLFEYVLVANSSIFSLIKMSSTISVYYLVKRGVFLSHAMTGFVIERFFDLGLHLLVSVFFIGSFSPVLLSALIIFTGMGILFTKKFEWFTKWKIIRKLSDFRGELNKIVNFKVGFVLIVLSILSLLFQSLAIRSLVGISLFLSISVVALGGIVIGASPTPFGLGVYEISIPSFLISQGVSAEVAIGGILTYRFLTVWMPAILGLFVVNKRL
ncbi:MAG: hypothetical protein GOU98_04310 [Candidatus Altiarchaeota archaeon]|nr:hypothetical protein [Candidatus Altiarchaeota archaeon]